MYLEPNSGGIFFQILLVCLIIGIGVTVLIVKRKSDQREKKEHNGDYKVASNTRPDTMRILSILTRVLFIITIIAIAIDLVLATSATSEYAKTINHIRELEKQYEQATDDDIIFKGAELSLENSRLNYAWHANYPASNGRLLIYFPLFLAGIAWLFWQYHAREILIPKKTIGFWMMALLGILGFGAMKIYLPAFTKHEQLPVYFLLLASDVLFIISAIIGYRIIVNTSKP